MMDPGALEAKSALRLPDLEHAETAVLMTPGWFASAELRLWLESFFLYRASAL
jgi:hypothetical protein